MGEPVAPVYNPVTGIDETLGEVTPSQGTAVWGVSSPTTPPDSFSLQSIAAAQAKIAKAISGNSKVYLAQQLSFLNKQAVNAVAGQNFGLQTPPVEEGYFWYVPFIDIIAWSPSSLAPIFAILCPPGVSVPTQSKEPTTAAGVPTPLTNFGIIFRLDFPSENYPYDTNQQQSPRECANASFDDGIVVPQGWSLAVVSGAWSGLAANTHVGDIINLKLGYVVLPNTFQTTTPPDESSSPTASLAAGGNFSPSLIAESSEKDYTLYLIAMIALLAIIAAVLYKKRGG